jgi:MATE family multidrug resistance protein
VVNPATLKPFLMLNSDIFIRTLCLQIAFAFMTVQGTKLGVSIVSANVVLLNFLMLIAFSMDGLAYAAEALVGKNIGERNLNKLTINVKVTLFWATIFSLVQFAIFYVWGNDIIAQITSISAVQVEAKRYLPWLIIIPLTSMLGFLRKNMELNNLILLI